MAAGPTLEREWTADEFVATDQHKFGPLWRYELVDGQIIGHAAPNPEHGAIIVGLSSVLLRELAANKDGCRPEAGSAATPRSEQRNTARIPDAIVRCGEHPRAAFEVVSPSEIRDWRGRDLKRKHLEAVYGLVEIVELYQEDYAAHVYRRSSESPDQTSWSFEAVGGKDAMLRLASLSIDLSLAEIYQAAIIPRIADEP